MSDYEPTAMGGRENNDVIELQHQNAVCSFDIEKYRNDITEFDLTDEQADELLKTLWTMMTTFVELGFGVDSIHYLLAPHTQPHCDEDSGLLTTNDAAQAFNSVASKKYKKGTS